MPDDVTQSPAVRLRVPATLDEIANVRRQLTRLVIDAGDDRSIAHDIALAASELCTNVVQYAGPSEYHVSCERRDDRWILEISHAEGVDLDRVSPAPRSNTGRGLTIVQALMDSVELVDTDLGTAIRCITAPV